VGFGSLLEMHAMSAKYSEHRDVISVETSRSRDVLTSRLGSRIIASHRYVLFRGAPCIAAV